MKIPEQGAVGESLFYKEVPTYYDSGFGHDRFSDRIPPTFFENTVQAMIEGVGEDACLLGSDGTILAVNPAWKEAVDTLDAQGISVGDNLIQFIIDAAAAEGRETPEMVVKRVQEVCRGERARFRHLFPWAGDVGQSHFSVKMSALAFGDEHYVLVLSRDVTEEQRLKRRRRALTARLSNAQARERGRMAQELRHCTAGPLVGLEHGLSQLKAGGAPPAGAIAACNEAIEAVQRDVRALSLLWHPPSIEEHGLASALEILVTGFCSRLRIESEVVVGEMGTLPRPTEALLYSLAQTALDGVFHQDRPTLIRLRIATLSQYLHVIIEYDAPLSRPRTLEIAMESIEEQLTDMNGRLSIYGVLRSTFIAASLPRRRAAG